MPALSLVGLDRVMALSEGSPAVTIGVLDGPVSLDHPAFGVPDGQPAEGAAAAHGTMATGVLGARRDAEAQGVCPGCRVLSRPIFTGAAELTADPVAVAEAVVEVVDAGARLVNLSAAFPDPSGPVRALAEALDHAAAHGAIVVAASGNSGRMGGSPLVSHPWVIPVGSCDADGHPLQSGNLGVSVARRGVLAPGYGITAPVPGGGYGLFTGTSAATTLVTGALALAWSAAPELPGAVLRQLLIGNGGRRRAIVPPLLDAWSLYESASKQEAR